MPLNEEFMLSLYRLHGREKWSLPSDINESNESIQAIKDKLVGGIPFRKDMFLWTFILLEKKQ